MWCVYATFDTDTGRYYVGKTYTLRLTAGYQGSGIWVRRAVKAGNSLRTILLSRWEYEVEAYDAEQFVVTMLRGWDRLCMNMAEGGRGGQLGSKRTSETRAKLSVTSRRAMENPELKARVMKALNTEEARRNYMATRDKMAAGSLAYWATEGAKERQSERLKAAMANPERRAAARATLIASNIKRGQIHRAAKLQESV